MATACSLLPLQALISEELLYPRNTDIRYNYIYSHILPSPKSSQVVAQQCHIVSQTSCCIPAPLHSFKMHATEEQRVLFSTVRTCSNRLHINAAKTEVIWCSSTRHQHQIPQSLLVVSSDAVVPVRVVRDMGICLDSDLMIRTHVAKTVSSCFCGVETASQHPAVCVRSTLAECSIVTIGLGCTVWPQCTRVTNNDQPTTNNVTTQPISISTSFTNVK